MNVYEMTYTDEMDEDNYEKVVMVEAEDIPKAIERLGDYLYNAQNPDSIDSIELTEVRKLACVGIVR